MLDIFITLSAERERGEERQGVLFRSYGLICQRTLNCSTDGSVSQWPLSVLSPHLLSAKVV